MMLHKKITVYFLVGIFFAPLLAMNNNDNTALDMKKVLERHMLVNAVLEQKRLPKEVQDLPKEVQDIIKTPIHSDMEYFIDQNIKRLVDQCVFDGFAKTKIMRLTIYLEQEQKELLHDLLLSRSNLKCNQETYNRMTKLPPGILSNIPFCWKEGVLVESNDKKKSRDRRNDLNEILIHAKRGAIYGVPVGIVASLATAGYDCLFAEQMSGLDKSFWIAGSCVVGGSTLLSSVAAKRFLKHEYERYFSDEEVPVRFSSGAIYTRKKLMNPSSFYLDEAIKKHTDSQEFKDRQRSILLTE